MASLTWVSNSILHHLITESLYNIKDENISLHLLDPLQTWVCFAVSLILNTGNSATKSVTYTLLATAQLNICTSIQHTALARCTFLLCHDCNTIANNGTAFIACKGCQQYLNHLPFIAEKFRIHLQLAGALQLPYVILLYLSKQRCVRDTLHLAPKEERSIHSDAGLHNQGSLEGNGTTPYTPSLNASGR